ncbi:MAG: N-acetylmuramoyl-L-alanine amidase [Clostridium sp.]|nr:N-acetylmuramoyl-L-alanine amidase [Clostridium sp.]
MSEKRFTTKIARLPLRSWVILIVLILVTVTLVGKGINRNKTGGEGAHAVGGDSEDTGDTLMPKNTDTKKKETVKKAIVVIDPGHGGEDCGTCNGELYEKDINLDISLELGSLLEERGVSIVYTRKTDVFVDLAPRAELANGLDAALFISVHVNALADYPNYKGTETLYCPLPEGSDRGNRMDGERFAKITQAKLIEALGTVDNGIIERPNLAVLRKTHMPAIIAEIAYLSNPSDMEKLANPAFRNKAAKALADSVIAALEEMGAFKDEDGVYSLTEQ